MSVSDAALYLTTPIEASDVDAGFRCGKHSLDDYFARHALQNDRDGLGRTYVLRRRGKHDKTLPLILGYYTLSMAQVASAIAAKAMTKKLPRYPMPAVLIGRLAVDSRAQGKRFGERLLIDALHKSMDASEIVACLGVMVDAKDEDAERFYRLYGFVVVEDEKWPHRMFMALDIARKAIGK